MTTTNKASALLTLPVELVTRIVDSLEAESLLMLRLTCKVLEDSTYDRFTKIYFEQRFCCVYYEPRWLLLRDIISSRLASRVRGVTFTPRPLESKTYKDLQIAPNEDQRLFSGAQSSANDALVMSLGPKSQVPAWAKTAVFHRIFRDMQRLSPTTLIKFEFHHDTSPELYDITLPTRLDIIVAAVTTGVAIDTFTVALHDTYWLNNVVTHLKSELTTSTTCLRRFRFDQSQSETDSYREQPVTTILQSAGDLRELVICFSPYNSATAAVLRRNNFSQLTTLRLRGAILPSKDFVSTLTHCHSMLHTHLSHLQLTGDKEAWSEVFGALTLVPRLHQLSLSVLRDQSLDSECIVFLGLAHGRTTHEG